MQNAECRRQKAVGGLLLVLASIIALPGTAWADGGTLRLSQRSGDYQISVFTSPAVLRAGVVDISVLMQDSATGAVRNDVPISIELIPADQPALKLEQPATTSAATNKMFRAAQFDVPRPGSWEARVCIGERQPAHVSFKFDVAPPPPAWLQLAPWVGWPLVLVALFIWHQRLASRRETRTSLAAAHAGSKPSALWAGTVR